MSLVVACGRACSSGKKPVLINGMPVNNIIYADTSPDMQPDIVYDVTKPPHWCAKYDNVILAYGALLSTSNYALNKYVIDNLALLMPTGGKLYLRLSRSLFIGPLRKTNLDSVREHLANAGFSYTGTAKIEPWDIHKFDVFTKT